MTVTFFGHSDYVSNLDDEEKIMTILCQNINCDNVEFLLGGYGNFDSFAYRCAKKYQACHPCARLIYVTPYPDRLNVSENYDLTVYPALESCPKKFAIPRRNKWMIQRSDIVIVYAKFSFGNSYKYYTLAKKLQKTVFNLAQ